MSKNERPRARDAGVKIGEIPTGKLNSITDVGGVRVGHVTIIAGNDGPLKVGYGPVRTGITAIIPHDGDIYNEKLLGCVYAINAIGDVNNALQVKETGVIDAPILLTNTLNTGNVYDAAIQYAVDKYEGVGKTHLGPNFIVAECSDAFLNDIAGRHVKAHHVYEAIASAKSGVVDEGNVGGGTGMICYRFKGGIGTSSRKLSRDFNGYTIGALVMTNFGKREQLRIDGVPVGLELINWHNREISEKLKSGSSAIIVLATDAPLSNPQLTRLAKRAASGMARTGAINEISSGDFVIAFSTANRLTSTDGKKTFKISVIDEESGIVDKLYQATIESVEEAIINSLFRAEYMSGRDGHHVYALPIDETITIMKRYGRLHRK